jgi:hypothetical protein
MIVIPTVPVIGLPEWRKSLFPSCSACRSSFLISPSHCRACGKYLCSNCSRSSAQWLPLPVYGITSSRHLVCRPCGVRNSRDLWKDAPFRGQSLHEVISGILVLHSTFPDLKRSFSEFSFHDLRDYLRCAFLCKDVPAVTLPDHSFVYCQREAWIRFASGSLNDTITCFLQHRNIGHPDIQSGFAKIRVGICIARLLASHPADDRPLHCWDAKRASFIDSEDETSLLLCLLFDFRNWTAVGDYLLSCRWLLPTLFSYKMADDSFDESEFLSHLASQQRTSEDTFFYLAAATLLKETPKNVLSLAVQLKEMNQIPWAIEVLCASTDIWGNSPQRTKAHLLLLQCFETIKPPEVPHVLLAGYRLLLDQLDGSASRDISSKLRQLEASVAPEHTADPLETIRRTLKYQQSLNSPELLAKILSEAFKNCDVEELRRVVEYGINAYASVPDRANLPGPIRANLMIPQALLEIVEGQVMIGVQRLVDALVLSSGSGAQEYSKLVAEVLTDPQSRYFFLMQLRDQLKSCVDLTTFLSMPWFADAKEVFSHLSGGEFKSARILRNSPELRGLRQTERAVDGVLQRDGPFEAAMCCLDLMSICPGHPVLVKMLLKASWFLRMAATTPPLNVSLPSAYACLRVSFLVTNLAEHFVEKESPATKVCFLRQILFLKLSLFETTLGLNPVMHPPEAEEDFLSIQSTSTSLLNLQTGFPVLCTVNQRAFDDLLTGIILDKLSGEMISRLKTRLAGLVTYEQWAYWRFEGAWQNWLHNPLDDPDDTADALRQEQKSEEKARRLEAGLEQTPAEISGELREEREYQDQRALKKQANARKFLDMERVDAMCRYLQEKQWPWESMSRVVNCMCVPRTPDGFIDPTKRLPPRGDFLFSSFDGFAVDRKTGTVKFLVTESRRSGKPALFGWKEIGEILRCGAPAMIFSLDAIDTKRPHHPFQTLHFKPDNCRGTTVLSCMFHTDYLLKFLTCGLEISASPPFQQREVQFGFLQRLRPHIREDLSVIWKSQRSGNDAAHRFWIDAGQLPHSATESEDQYSVLYGKQTMRIKKHKLRRNADGELVDDDELDRPDDLEALFASNFTRHYDAVAAEFPEFAMLAEFSKIINATSLLLREAERNKAILNSLSKAQSDITDDVEDKLRSAYGSIEFPLSSPSKISEMVEDHVQETNKLNSYRLSNDQKSQVRSSARPQIVRAFEEAENSLVSKLASNLETSASAVRHMLLHKHYRTIAADKARSIVNDLKTTHERALSNLRREGLPVDGDLAQNITAMFSGDWSSVPAADLPCEWVPAVFRLGSPSEHSGVYRVYGGVSLQAQLAKQVLNPPPNSQYVTSATTLSAQRALGAPFSTASKIDNQHRATQDFFDQRQRLLQQERSRQWDNLVRDTGCPVWAREISRSFGGIYHRRVDIQGGGPANRYYDSPQGKAGPYWTPDTFANRTEARNKLAVLNNWNAMSHHAASTIPPGTVLYVGTAACQEEPKPASTIRPGGATQYVIVDRDTRSAMAKNATAHGPYVPNFFKPKY